MTLASPERTARRGGLVTTLPEAIRAHVRPGMHLHFASTPSRSNAAVRELARAYFGKHPGFRISATGFHSLAHLLPLLHLGESLVGCFFGDHYPAPRPNALYTRAAASGVALEHWSLWSLVSSLRAAALGDCWALNRSLAGTSIAAELAERGAYREVEDPREPGRTIGLCAALRPDVTFVHATAADDEGHVILSGPIAEGVWSSLAAKRGVIVTVERLAWRSWTGEHPDQIVLPPHRVLAVCEEPFGAHPQPFFGSPELDVPPYRDDFEHYERWHAMTGDEDALGRFIDQVILPADGGAAYRAYVGHERLDALRVAPAVSVRRTAAPKPAPVPPGPVEQLIVAGARRLAVRARAIGARVLLAGIGQAFFAARIAQLRLAAEGYDLRVMVETGLYDVDCGADGHGYLLAYDNMARARRLTGIEDILGALGCGADNHCLAALGAAQIDRLGNLNSTRLDGRTLVGSGGACDIAASVEEVVVMTRFQRGRLVDRLEYLTSPGHVVRTVVTDRCVLSRAEPAWTSASDPGGGTWALESVTALDEAASVSDEVARLQRDCPWSIEPVPHLGFEAPITDEELALLAALDPDGIYRRRAA